MSDVAAARAEVPGILVTDYMLRRPGRPSELVLLLHGSQQNGKYMFEKLADLCPANAAVLAPNGPYPLPERKEDGTYKVGFSWYFYNFATDAYFIDMRVALAMLESLVRQLGLDGLPMRILGFSQGGYLASVAAVKFKDVRQVVGIAASYLPEEMQEMAQAAGTPWPPRFRVDGLHGAEDDVVEPDGAHKLHSELLQAGAQGEFVVLPGVGHRIPSEMRKAVRTMLAKFPSD